MSLLTAYEDHQEDDFLEKPFFEVGKLLEDVRDESLRLKAREEVPPQIPGYTIQKSLGSGAMGQVFLATQEQLARPVAVKVLRPRSLEHHYEEFVVRFRNECKVLAMLPHENIAKIYEVGRLEDERPFFTLEYLEGAQTVQQFCDQIGADIHQRLRLFLKICDGVAFAHRNAIVHRDLKPSNILIDPESRQPKIIDFGIAKSIQPHAAIDFTETPDWRPMGTPPFISPEQLRRSEGVVADTRSDVYALGMLLYVLLTDTRPFLPDEEAAFDFDLWKKIVEEPASAPSHAYLQCDPARRRAVAERRAVTPVQLVAQLKRDLDWIVLKAVRKNPDDRYQSVLALADDIERYLTHQPVKARPDSWFYHVSKFVRRHWLSVTVGCLFGTSLLTLATIAFFNNQKAIREAERVEVLLEHLKGVVDLSDPLFPDLFRDVTRRKVANELQTAIEVSRDADLRMTLMEIQGTLLYGLGDYRQAGDRYTGLVRLAERRLGPRHERTLRAAYWAGVCSMALEEADRALMFFDRVLPDVAVLAPHLQMRLRRARVEALRQLGQTKSDRLIELLEVMEADVGVLVEPRSFEASQIAVTKGHVHRDVSQFKLAETAYHRALNLRLNDGRVSDPIRGITYNYLAVNARMAGRLDDALEYALHGRGLLEGALRRDHPYLLQLYNNLGNIYSDLGRLAEAEPLLRKALLLRSDADVTVRPFQTNMLNNLADLYLGWGCAEDAEAVKLFELTVRGEGRGTRDLNHWASLLTLAEIYQAQGRHGEAAMFLETVLTEWPLESHVPYYAVGMSLLARSEAEQGRYEHGFALFRQARLLSSNGEKWFPGYFCEAAVVLAEGELEEAERAELRAFLAETCP
nr:serine/threonine-protein kinase [Acanthopleuribacter pedis]